MTEQTIVIQTPEESPSELQEVETLEAEAIEAAAEVEQTETVADSAVEIAQIEAAKEVAIAETNAAVELERINASETNHELERENSWLREQMNLQEQRLATLEALVLSTPQPSPEAEQVETILTPQSTLEETSETPMEASLESAVENLEQETQAVVRGKRIAI